MSDPSAAPIPSDPSTPPPDRAAFWRDALADFAPSGQTVRAFGSARGLHEKRSHTWRRTLGLSPTGRPVATTGTPARAFVPVRVVADPAAEVTPPGGVTVRVPVSSDPSHVARLGAALRGGAC